MTETDDQQTPIKLMTDEMHNLTRRKSLEWSDEGDSTDMDYITDSSDYICSLSDSSDVTENLAVQEEIVWNESFQNLSELSMNRAMSTLVKPSVIQEKITRQERLHMYELRHHLNTLNTNLEKAEKLVCEKREELKKCNETIENLKAEEENVFKELQEAERETKITAVNRLKSHHKRIKDELEQEMSLKDQISQMLNEAEHSYVSADVEKGKFQLAEEYLDKREKDLSQEQVEISRLRQYKEELKAWRAKRNEEMKMSQHIREIKQKELQLKLRSAEAQKAKASTAKFLRATLEKFKKEEEEAEVKLENEMTQKIQMILALKQVIETKKGSMNKRIRKEKKKKELEKKQELEEREKIVQEGGNADIVMLLKQKQKKENQEKLMFQRKQEENYQKIVKKLLLEDSLKKKDEKQQKALKKKQKRDFTRQKIGVQKAYPMTKKFEALLNSNFPEDKEMKDKESSQNQESKPILQQELLLDSDEESEKEVAILKKQLSEESADDEDGDLAAPEFEGMWYRQESNLNLETLKNVPKEGKHNQSKMEKEIMERQMEKLRNQTVEKKILAGKELKGCSFYGKPDVIHFKYKPKTWSVDVEQTRMCLSRHLQQGFSS